MDCRNSNIRLKVREATGEFFSSHAVRLTGLCFLITCIFAVSDILVRYLNSLTEIFDLIQTVALELLKVFGIVPFYLGVHFATKPLPFPKPLSIAFAVVVFVLVEAHTIQVEAQLLGISGIGLDAVVPLCPDRTSFGSLHWIFFNLRTSFVITQVIKPLD